MKKLTFEWKTGTANDNMIKAFKKAGVTYGNDYYFNLCADLGYGFAPVEYYCIDNTADIFGITYRPQRTTEYFDMTGEELFKTIDGWTKEELMLCDSHPYAKPFVNTLKAALEHAEWLKEQGHDDIKILERINNKYAVIAH